ncbi:tetratricopeptide repeat protein [Streptomyces sp. NPDC002276]
MSELGARASGQGRIFQTSGDQYIEEHHHHYDGGGSGPLFGERVVPPESTAGSAAPDSVRMPLVGRPPGILRNREELRALLGAAVAAPGHAVHVVHGMGGCGKTALAHWLFTRAVREEGRIGFWVNASERMSLRAGMLAVAGDRGAAAGELAAAAAGQRAAADLVWHYLDHSAEPWLLVLDNADDPTVLEDGAWLRTSGQGTVLVTTRHATSALWRGPGVTRHALGVLPLEDAAQVLCDLAPDAGDLDSARKVAERLGRLPLALALAGSHLAHQLLESWSMDEYDRKLGEESTAIVDQGADGYGDRSRHLVGRTWQLSLDALARQGLPEATTLLRLLSLLAADPVPLRVLAPLARGEAAAERLEPALTATRLEPALRGLLDHSLAELVQTDGVRCVQAHGVLLDSVAATMPEQQRGVLAELAADLLNAALPDGDVDPTEARSGLALLAPHASALLKAGPGERTAVLAVHVVREAIEAGDFPGALALAPGVADRVEGLLGTSHQVALDARDAQARVLFRMGHYAESEALYRQVLARCEAVLGPDHPDTLRSRFGLQAPLDLLGRDEEAEQLLRSVLDGQRRVLGETSRDTLYTWAILLELLIQLGRAEEFEDEGHRLIGLCERELPPGDYSTVVARHNYAHGLLELGRCEEAEPLALQVMADRIRLHGVDHPMALSARYLLAEIAYGLGRTGEAVEMLQEIIEGRDRVLGPDHPIVVGDRERLATWQAEARP